jgi:hypothetical protein
VTSATPDKLADRYLKHLEVEIAADRRFDVLTYRLRRRPAAARA